VEDWQVSGDDDRTVITGLFSGLPAGDGPLRGDWSFTPMEPPTPGTEFRAPEGADTVRVAFYPGKQTEYIFLRLVDVVADVELWRGVYRLVAPEHGGPVELLRPS